MRGRKFELDRANGKIMGVCAGIANYFDVDPTFVRIGAVVATLLGGFPWTLLAYGVAAWLAKPKKNRLDYDVAEDIRTLRGMNDYDHRAPRDIDRRLAEVDSYIRANSHLSREIEELR